MSTNDDIFDQMFLDERGTSDECDYDLMDEPHDEL